MANLSVTLAFDSTQLVADIELLAKTCERSVQLIQRLFDLGDLGSHIVCVDFYPPLALPADQRGIHLQFSDALLELVAAVRAGDFDGLAV